MGFQDVDHDAGAGAEMTHPCRFQNRQPDDKFTFAVVGGADSGDVFGPGGVERLDIDAGRSVEADDDAARLLGDPVTDVAGPIEDQAGEPGMVAEADLERPMGNEGRGPGSAPVGRPGCAVLPGREILQVDDHRVAIGEGLEDAPGAEFDTYGLAIGADRGRPHIGRQILMDPAE